MLVESMHGTFEDFLLPGIFLFGIDVVECSEFFCNTAKQKDGLDVPPWPMLITWFWLK